MLKLPIVVSMANVAASGGYWVATPADKIFAEPDTITGSIGVFGVVPTVEGSLAKLGITSDGVRAGSAARRYPVTVKTGNRTHSARPAWAPPKPPPKRTCCPGSSGASWPCP